MAAAAAAAAASAGWMPSASDSGLGAGGQGFSWALAEVGERVGLHPRYTRAFSSAAAAAAEADRAAAYATAALEKLLLVGSDSDDDSLSFSDEGFEERYGSASDDGTLASPEGRGFKVATDWTPRTLAAPKRTSSGRSLSPGVPRPLRPQSPEPAPSVLSPTQREPAELVARAAAAAYSHARAEGVGAAEAARAAYAATEHYGRPHAGGVAILAQERSEAQAAGCVPEEEKHAAAQTLQRVWRGHTARRRTAQHMWADLLARIEQMEATRSPVGSKTGSGRAVAPEPEPAPSLELELVPDFELDLKPESGVEHSRLRCSSAAPELAAAAFEAPSSLQPVLKDCSTEELIQMMEMLNAQDPWQPQLSDLDTPPTQGDFAPPRQTVRSSSASVFQRKKRYDAAAAEEGSAPSEVCTVRSEMSSTRRRVPDLEHAARLHDEHQQIIQWRLAKSLEAKRLKEETEMAQCSFDPKPKSSKRRNDGVSSVRYRDIYDIAIHDIRSAYAYAFDMHILHALSVRSRYGQACCRRQADGIRTKTPAGSRSTSGKRRCSWWAFEKWSAEAWKLREAAV